MIEIKLENPEFEQDIRPLVRAMIFYADIKVSFEEASVPSKVEGLTLSVSHKPEILDIWLLDEKGRLIRKKEEFSEPLFDKKCYRNIIKRTLYLILAEYTGTTLPWGTLTGIRPTKLAYDFLEVGYSEEEIKEHYKTEFFSSDEKIELSLDIAKRERRLLSGFDYKNGYSIYIGIPFCPTTCLYCSFTSYPIGRHLKEVGTYLQALFKEIDFASTMFPHKKLNTVYIGGGTPTSLSAEELDLLLSYVNEKLPMAEVREFTVEAGRPDSLNLDKLKVMKKHGVHRMSINPQTMVDRTLKLIGRRHDAEEVKTSFKMAREVGIPSINMDLIIGLPGENTEDVKYTLSEIEKLNPDDITVHALAIKRAAGLKFKLEEFSEKNESVNISEMQDLTYLYAKEHGYKPYYLYRQKNIADNLENVGYAREGREGLYNILIMEEKQPIIGLGAGSSSKFVFQDGKQIERTENVKFFKDYVDRIDEMIERKQKFLEEFGDKL